MSGMLRLSEKKEAKRLKEFNASDDDGKSKKIKRKRDEEEPEEDVEKELSWFEVWPSLFLSFISLFF
jgi:hypothetical protein